MAAAKSEKGTRVNPFTFFEEEILETIIGPKIISLFYLDSPDEKVNSKSALKAVFEDRYECRVSDATFKHWLDKLGIVLETTVVVKGLPAPPEETFDNEAPRDIPRAVPGVGGIMPGARR